MTELKIKQADINNNGNQRLMGDMEGDGEAQNMYHVWLWMWGVGEKHNTTQESSSEI